MTEPRFQFLEVPGPHSVGLKVLEQFDYSRLYKGSSDAQGKPYKGERARPIQVLVWFPAEPSTAKRMCVADYVKLLETETSYGQPAISPALRELSSAMRLNLADPLWAVRDAPHLGGRFPVVVYAPSFSAPSWENADLCEYLASHGYVVLSSPSMGTATRSMTRDLGGIGAQAADVAFLIALAHILPNADVTSIAAVGFSWGGMSSVFAAARDDRIRALVALDGSMRYFPGWIEQAADVNPEELEIPLLSFAQRHFSLEDHERYSTAAERSGRNVLNAWKHGDVVNVHMLRLTHAEYSSMFQRNDDVWWKLSNVYPMMKADFDRQDGSTGYAWLARYTRQFLDAYLKGSAAAKSFLKRTPAENGVPKHHMAVEFREAAGPPISFPQFKAKVGRVGFDETARVYAEMKAIRADFVPPEVTMECWGDELLASAHVAEAISVLRLNAQLHPFSSAACVRLGRAYEEAGHSDLARDSYRKALELEPANGDARRGLMLMDRGAS